MKHAFFDNLVWADIEYSSIKLEEAFVLEIAVVITDSDFNELDSGEWVIHQESATLETMKQSKIVPSVDRPDLAGLDNTYDLHKRTGLIEKVINSKISLAQAEKEILELINKYFPSDVRPILAGNSIYFDKTVIRLLMPGLNGRLHYRTIDISTLKQLFLNDGTPSFQKQTNHRALGDTRESIAELKYLLSLK